MRDVYANPTIRRLARALDAQKPAETASLEVGRPTGRRTSPITPAARRRPRSTSSSARSRSPPVRPRSTGSTRRSTRPVTLYARALAVGGPVVLRPQRARHRRQMAARRPRARRARSRCGARATSASGRPSSWCARRPAIAFAGTPLFNLYLRLLGAKIGRQRRDRLAHRAGRPPRTCSRSARTRSSCAAR